MIRTGFSFRAAVGTIENVISRLQEIGSEYAPIADRASTFGFVKWKKAALKAGMKPIFGVELAVTPSIHAKKPVIDYWTFLAKDNIAAINELVKLATSQFHYEPLLNYEQAISAKGVFKIAGPHAQLANLPAVLPNDLFFGLSPAVSQGFIQAVGANFQGSAWVARSENKFPRPEDDGLYEVLCGRGASMQTYPQYILSPTEWRTEIEQFAPELIEGAEANFKAICSLSTADLKKGTLLAPERPDTLEALCRAGAERLGIDLKNNFYGERLNKELALIEEKNFADYFYIIADMMQFARKNMVCGPARGSSCGSLVCYLLGITTIDPIKYDLIFERFIDINRGGWFFKESFYKEIENL